MRDVIETGHTVNVSVAVAENLMYIYIYSFSRLADLAVLTHGVKCYSEKNRFTLYIYSRIRVQAVVAYN